MSEDRTTTRLRRDLRFGVLWFVVLYLYDLGTSYWVVSTTLQQVRHVPEVKAVTALAVGAELLRMFGAYVLMGGIAGLMIHLFLRAFQVPAEGLRRWRYGFAIAVVLWLNGRGAILWPQMYTGGPGANFLANHGQLWWFDGLLVAAFLGALVRSRHRIAWRPLAAFLLGTFLISLLDEHPKAPIGKKNQGPNVIVIGFDALRPDHLASFGYERDTAPRLDAFLARAAVFERAFTPLARTWGAWSSMLTGAEPWMHGQRDSLPPIGQERPDVPMLTDALQDAGVHSVFLTDDSRFSYMLPSHNFQVIDQPPVGITSLALSKSQPSFRAFFTFLNGPIGWALVPVYRYNQAMGVTFRPEYFAERVAGAIAEASEHDRFFLAAHFCILHAPGDRSYPYDRMYGMSEYEGDNRFGYRSTGSELADGEGVDALALEALESKSGQQNIDLYDSGIAMIDLSWARIEQALDEAGLWENTTVIVLSDHGEEFFEEGIRYRFRGPNHGFHPFGVGQSRVLLAVHAPGEEGFRPGRREDLVSLVDIAPTVMEALDVPFDAPDGFALQEPVPPGRLVYGETGVSESSYWAPGHYKYSFKRAARRYTVDPETGRVYQFPKYEVETVRAKDRWVADDTFCVTEEALEAGPRYQMFRWRLDPVFRTEVSAQYPDDFLRLVTALATHPRDKTPPAMTEAQP